MESASDKTSRSYGDEITLGSIVGFFQRNWLWMVGPAILLGVVMFVWVRWTTPLLYRATAVLVVEIAEPGRPSAGQGWSLHAYRAFVTSDSVKAEARGRLEEAGAELSQGPISYQAGILVAPRQETMALAPVLELTAWAPDAKTAALAANTWAETAVARISDLAASLARSGVQGDVARYATVSAALREAEQEQAQLLADEFTVKEKTAATWRRRRSSSLQKSLSQIESYRNETRGMLETLVEDGITSRGFDDDRPDPDRSVQIEAVLRQLAVLRAQLANAPVTSAPEVEGISGAMPSADAGCGEPLGRSELPHEPMPENLSTRVTDLELELLHLAGSDGEWALRLASELERLQRQRRLGLAELRLRQAEELANLKDQCDSQMSAVGQENRVRLRELERTMSYLGTLQQTLAGGHDGAAVVGPRPDREPARIAAPAYPTGAVQPRRSALKAMGAAFFGGFFGLVVALFREVKRTGA